MSEVILAFHGYTQNGQSFGAGVAPLAAAVAPRFGFVYPDAPHACPAESVSAFYAHFRGARPEPPHHTWWRATDDGSVYTGWERTREFMGELAERHGPIGVLGFSQGAMLATLFAALAARGELPPIRFAVLVAGGVPRAHVLAPLLETKIRVPTLHVWGRRDTLCATQAPELVERFEPEGCHTLLWPGSHVFPTRGFPVEVMAAFIAAHSPE